MTLTQYGLVVWHAEEIRFSNLDPIGMAGCLNAGSESSLVDGLGRVDELVECLVRG